MLTIRTNLILLIIYVVVSSCNNSATHDKAQTENNESITTENLDTMVDSIELMHSYIEFPNDASNAFKKLTEKYNLKPTVDNITSINFENKYCKLNFNMDRYDLQGLIYLNNSGTVGESHSINQVISNLYPDSNFLNTFPKTSYGNKESIRQLLNWYADMVDKYLSDILQGNYSHLDQRLNKKASQ